MVDQPDTTRPIHVTAPIAALMPWGFWCRYESIGIDDETQRAVKEGRISQEQGVRLNHMIASARDSLIAMVPISRSLS
jgi:hypothetical protein